MGEKYNSIHVNQNHKKMNKPIKYKTFNLKIVIHNRQIKKKGKNNFFNMIWKILETVEKSTKTN